MVQDVQQLEVSRLDVLLQIDKHVQDLFPNKVHRVAIGHQRRDFIHVSLVVNKLSLDFGPVLVGKLPTNSCVSASDGDTLAQVSLGVFQETNSSPHHNGIEDPQISLDIELAILSYFKESH